MHTAFLGASDPAWAEALAGLRHDFYHLPAYVQFAARRQETGEALAYLAEDSGRRFFLPLILRPVPPDFSGARALQDAVCPRGYPGPLAAIDPGPDGELFVADAVRELCAGLRDRGVVSAFARLHPLLMPPLKPLSRAGTLVDHGDSVSIDLRQSPDELRRQTRENHRRDIRKATAGGYAARIDEKWERFDEFAGMYAQSMRRLGASEAWSFSREYFLDLRQTLGDAMRLCVVEVADELAAATLLTEVDGIVEYHLAATAARHVAASPLKLAVDCARWWAQNRGDRVFHLAGSLRRGDSLSHFKAGFSPLRHPVCSWRVIADPVAYGELVERWEARYALTADPPDGYFPAYRRPETGFE
jgi:CelD/BcsL family acetyltransferase involved in cellulose biosynthesis